MVLHDKDSVRERLDDDVYASVDLSVSMPKYRFPNAAKDLPEELVFWVNYLGGNMRDIALNFSRPGGQVVCQYYNFLRLGKEGYRKIHTACYEPAEYIAGEIEKLRPFEIIYRGTTACGSTRKTTPTTDSVA